MTTRIKLRRDTAANWESVNPTLANGEMGIEANTRRAKLGDGVTAWNDLKYAMTDQLRIDGKTVNGEMGVSIASQDPETWISTVKSKANWAGADGVAYDSKGNLYFSGYEESGFADGSPFDGNGRAFLIKYDSKGTVLWSKYTQLSGYSSGGGVVVDVNDNVIVATVSWDDEYFAVIKYTEAGAVVWKKEYTDSNDYALGWAMAIDSNSNIVIVGRRTDPDANDNTGIFVTKILGATGAVSWTRTMGNSSTNAWAPSVAIDGDDNIIIGGMDSGNSDGTAALAKLSSSGSEIWKKTLRNPEREWDGYELDLGSIDADEDGNIYFVGSYVVPDFVTNLNGNFGDGRAGLILKMNSNGIVQWSRIVGPGDCDDLGAHIAYKAGKLYATFQTERPYYKNDSYRNDTQGYTTQEIILACYDTANGKVLWQNKFGPEVLWGYTSPTGDSTNSQDRETYSGRLIAVHGNYVAMVGQAGEYSRADDTETRSYGFLAQLPADGSEMDLEGWAYKTANARSLYAKVQSEDGSNYSINPTTDIVATTSSVTPTSTSDNIRIELIAAGSNQWDFKPNGDLALPVGGNIEISRATQGSINVVGYFDSDNNSNIGNYFNSVTTDADGNQYYVGQWNWHGNSTDNGNDRMPLVVKVNTEGQVEWKVRLGNSRLMDTYWGVDGEARAVAYDPESGNIVVVCTDSGEGNSEQMLIVDLNATNGDVIESRRYEAANDIRANGITINPLGERFITGLMQGDNNVDFTVTSSMAVVDQSDTLMVPATVFDGAAKPGWLTGTNGWSIVSGSNLTEIDLYENVTGTVRQGSGATFDVTANGSGGYTVVLGTSGGSNYRAGHKIKIAGDSLGGTTPTNDAVITVDDATNGVIVNVSISGTSTGSSTYTSRSGTNYNVGSGFTINVQVDNTKATNNLIVYHADGGSNYVVGDVITFAGTQFGGTSPATDIVITALQVGEFLGDVQATEDTGYVVTTRGVSPRTYVRLQFSGADFTIGGPDYTLRHFTTANTFLAKFNPAGYVGTNLVWAKWIDKSDWDNGVAVDYDSEGNLYWASSVFDEETIGGGNVQNRALVTKVSSTGTLIWSKTYSIDGSEGHATGLQVDSEDKVVLGYEKNHSNQSQYDPVVVRLNSDGDQLWVKRYLLDGGEGAGGGLALDNDDNIYITAENYDGEDDVSWAAKLDIQSGDEIWQQMTGHPQRIIRHGWNDRSNAVATDGKKYYVASYTEDIDGNEGNAIAVALPADGSANDTEHGPFAVDQSFYNNEGGSGNGGFDEPVVRNYTLGTAPLTVITNRETIRSWIESGPTSYYAVNTNSDAGIVFGDGTVQTTSGSGIPQVRHKRYYDNIKLKLTDAGKHLYITNGRKNVYIPSYSEVPFPVGTVITIVNLGGDYVYVTLPQDFRSSLRCPPLDGSESSWSNDVGYRFQDLGGGCLITLLKIEESWSNGSRWIVTGNNGSNFN